MRFVENVHIGTTGSTDLITQRFEVAIEKDGKLHVIGVETALMRRTYEGLNESRWQVYDCRADSIPSNLP